MLRESGYTTGEAVAAYAFIGPAQLAGRIAILTLERFISLTAAGVIGTVFPVVAVVILITLPAHSPLVFVFAVAFGTRMGIKSIVQATAAPELLGRAGYGALQGALMFPVYLAQAVSPLHHRGSLRGCVRARRKNAIEPGTSGTCELNAGVVSGRRGRR